MYAYPLNTEPDDNDTLLVTCPDIPELTTDADDETDVPNRGALAATAVLDAYICSGWPIPRPSPAHGRPIVRLAAQVTIKLGIYEKMRASGISQADLAQQLNVEPKQVQHLLDLTRTSRFGLVEAALQALGLDVEIRGAAETASRAKV